MENKQVEIAMRRTSISLAIVALLLCGQSFGHAMGPQGEIVAPGVTAPVPQAGQPAPGMILPVPEQMQPTPAAVSEPAITPQPATVPQAVATPQTPHPAATYQGDASMFQPQAMPGGYAPAAGQGVWNQPLPGGPTDPSCAVPGCALCGAGTACPKGWYVDQRVRIMTHPKPRAKSFGSWQTLEVNQLNQLVLVRSPATSSRSLPFDLSSSYEVTIGRYLGLDTYNRDHFLEFTFYGTNHWGAAGTVIANEENEGFLDADGNIVSSSGAWVTRGVFGNIYGGSDKAAGFNRADSQSSEYRSSLNNFEINLQMRPRARADRLVLHKNGKWRRQCQEGIFCNWLAGARIFSMNESYQFQSTANFAYFDQNGDPEGTGTSRASYQTTAHNTLIGLQAGPNWTYRKCRAECGVGAKAAAYINFAEQQTWIDISGAAGDRFSNGDDLDIDATLTKNTSAVSLELDFHASYKVRPNFILKINYELLYIAGLALAPEQVNMGFDESLTIGTGGALLFQSATLGAEYTW